MKWSKLRHTIESNLAASVKGRIQFHVARYRQREYQARGWISVDGEEVVNMYTNEICQFNETTPNVTGVNKQGTNPLIAEAQRTPGMLIEKDEFGHHDLVMCMGESLNMTTETMIHHDSPLIQLLGIIHRKTGKRTLLNLRGKEFHRLPRFFLDLRLEAEGILQD